MPRLDTRLEKTIRENRRSRDFVKMLLPVAGILIALGEWYGTPIKYPLTYTNTTDPIWFPTFMFVALAVYAVFYVIAIFSGRVRVKLVRYAWLFCVVALLFSLWDLLTLKSGVLKLPFMPGPDKVLSVIPLNWEDMLNNFVQSITLLAEGVAIGIVTGAISGLLIGWSYFFDYWLNPLMKMIGPVPSAAWLPIVIAIMPSSHAAGVFLIALAVWFPLTLMLSSALKSTDLKKIEVARVLGASEPYILVHVALPSALPSIFNGLFMGLSSSFGALVIAEQLGVQAGLGWYINWASAWAEYARVFATVGIFIILFYTLTALLFKIRDRIMKWQEGTIKW